jgi:predicted anti-sigma-YlaC factor YlaD
MDCAQAQELITALVDDELSGSERAAIEEHLKQCSSCRFARAQELALKTEVQRGRDRLKSAS